MKLLYLSTWDFTNEKSDGVCKKMYSQLRVFEKRGYQVDFIYIKDGKVIYREDGEERAIATVGTIRKTPAYIKMYRHIKDKKYDCVYNRYGMADTFYNRVIKRLWENGAKIYVEVPSYPYEGEREPGLLYWIMFKWDEICRKRLKKYVSNIVMYMDYDKLFGIDTIRLINGVDVSNIKPVQKMERDSEAIHLLIVTLMMKHHGYERLIEGFHEYYQAGGMRKVICHVVGDGVERPYYEELVKKYNLEENIIFYGLKSGAELDAFYEYADFGVTAMGLYKDNIFLTSELKSREYLAKGLPLISGAQIDIFRGKDKWFYNKFSEDATPIDIGRVVQIYDDMCKDRTKEEAVKEIRRFAEETVDMSETMKLLFEYMET